VTRRIHTSGQRESQVLPGCHGLSNKWKGPPDRGIQPVVLRQDRHGCVKLVGARVRIEQTPKVGTVPWVTIVVLKRSEVGKCR
jgi:hypothetical protein